jgi:hypothetical protein
MPDKLGLTQVSTPRMDEVVLMMDTSTVLLDSGMLSDGAVDMVEVL